MGFIHPIPLSSAIAAVAVNSPWFNPPNEGQSYTSRIIGKPIRGVARLIIALSATSFFALAGTFLYFSLSLLHPMKEHRWAYFKAGFIDLLTCGKTALNIAVLAFEIFLFSKVRIIAQICYIAFTLKVIPLSLKLKKKYFDYVFRVDIRKQEIDNGLNVYQNVFLRNVYPVGQQLQPVVGPEQVLN